MNLLQHGLEVTRSYLYIVRMSDDAKINPGHHGMDVATLRRSATGFALDRDDLNDDPIVQFEDWFRYACETVPLDPNAVTLSTVDSERRPSSRTVLLKSFDERGFRVFHELREPKGRGHRTEPERVRCCFSGPMRRGRSKSTGQRKRFRRRNLSRTSCHGRVAARLAPGFLRRAVSSRRGLCLKASSRRSSRSSGTRT